MTDKSKKLKIDLSFLDSDNKEKLVWACEYCDKEFNTEEKACDHEKICESNPILKNKSEDVWECIYCDKEFNNKDEADKHEKNCKSQNNKVEKIYCIKCGSENQNDANYCKKCGSEIAENKKTNDEETNQTKNINIKGLEKGDKRFKSIYNAGTSAEALGWFNLVFSIILLFIGMIGGADGTYMFGLICTVVVSYIFIKHGKILKKVNNASMNNVKILLWTCLAIVVIAIFTQGSIGFLFLLELFYLFRARSVINKLTI